jgi:hypothetical protein
MGSPHSFLNGTSWDDLFHYRLKMTFKTRMGASSLI